MTTSYTWSASSTDGQTKSGMVVANTPEDALARARTRINDAPEKWAVQVVPVSFPAGPGEALDGN